MWWTRLKLRTCTCFHTRHSSSVHLADCRFTVYKDADLFDFINAPVGKGLPVTEKLNPLIAGPLLSSKVVCRGTSY